jgi:hypothetical protein
MTQHQRQSLAAYAFFEDARKGNHHTEDALIPFVLPAIAGRGGEIFSPDALAKDLEPIFGPELVLPLAQSLVEALSRQGYIRQEVQTDQAIVYMYTDKTFAIHVNESVSRAESDVALLMGALDDFTSATGTIKPIFESREVLQTALVDWLTTSESLSTDENQSGAARVSRARGAYAGGTAAAEQLDILFSAFVSWLSRERAPLFEKAVTFVELGLIIDLVSEIRVPSRVPNKIELTIVLDTPILLELLGLCGPLAQRTAQRLAELCKAHQVPIVTMAHLVDEVSEITYNVREGTDPNFRGSVNEAASNDPAVRQLLNKVSKNPDACIKATGVKIIPFTQIHDARAMASFTSGEIADFATRLGYDQSKRRRAERDAQSLAYAVRRQNGNASSSLYDSKCVVVTRSARFVSKARSFLREEKGYPNYVMTPVIELRHFSTLFMLAFGSDATGKVVRAELVASCDRIVKASPHLIERIRAVLGRMEVLTDEQIEAALSDPVTLAEFALVTGNDASVVTPQNGPALLAVVREATVKEEELRHRARELQQKAEYEKHLEDERAKLGKADERIAETENRLAEAEKSAAAQAEANQRLASEIQEHAGSTAALLAQQIRREVRRIWLLPIVIAIFLGALLTLDVVKDITGMPEIAKVLMAIPLGGLFLYSTLALVLPEIEPAAFRRWLMKRMAARTLQPYPETMQERVRLLLGDSH